MEDMQMSFGEKQEQKSYTGANVEGQIKIDLSVETYEIDECRADGKRKIRKTRYPGLPMIMSVLKKTGARVLRISGKGKYTVIDYAA
jgi:hypothetical protein